MVNKYMKKQSIPQVIREMQLKKDTASPHLEWLLAIKQSKG